MIKTLQLTLKTKRMKKKHLYQMTKTNYLSSNSILSVMSKLFQFLSSTVLAKYDLNLIKSYLVALLVNEKEIEPTSINKATQIVAFKFGNVQFLYVMNFFGCATSLDSFLKAYKTSETKSFFSFEWFDWPDKLMVQSLPSYDD